MPETKSESVGEEKEMSATKTSILGSDSRLYQVWAGILTRCFNSNHPNYKNYGERGITVCDEWRKYAEFERWALNNGYDPNAPKKSQSIERIDLDGNYCPENCVWADPKTQQNNTRKNVFVEYKGERKTLAQWAERFGIGYSTFMSRWSRGWTMEQIEKKPVGRYRICRS